MRLNLRKCREKSISFQVLLIMCLLLGVIVIKNRNNIKNRAKNTKQEEEVELPTLLMTCNAVFLKRSMDSLIHFRSHEYKNRLPIIVATYCISKETRDIMKQYEWDPTITLLEISTPAPYYIIALNHVFKILKHKAVIVLEDNLDISPDFYEYFLGTYPLLKKDRSIWCVSAWNDNGRRSLVEASQYAMLHRTHFFPGMGWMILSEVWNEIEYSLPEEPFYYSLRDPTVTRRRVCIRPEISRTYEFGVYEAGKAKDMPFYYMQYNQRLLNIAFVPFTKLDLSYLLQKNEHNFIIFAYSCPESTVEDVKRGHVNSSLKYVRIPYSNGTTFRKAAQTFGLMDDFSHGVPRTGLYGVVQFFFNNCRVFLTPDHKPRIEKENKSLFTNISSPAMPTQGIRYFSED